MSFGLPRSFSNLTAARTAFTNGRERPRKRGKRSRVQLFPINAERQYTVELLKYVNTMTGLTRTIVFPALPAIVAQANVLRPTTDTFKTDDYADDIQSVVGENKSAFNEEYPDSRLEEIALLIALLVSRKNKQEVTKVLSDVSGIELTNVFIPEPFLQAEISAFVKQNVSLINTIEDRYFSEIEGIMFRGTQQGLRVEEIRQQIIERFKVSRNRAKLIARDQVNKLNGQLTKLRQTAVGVKEYIWRDSRDGRVRGNPAGISPNAIPSHWARNGKKFKWSKPPSGGHPGQPIQCRCFAQPVLPKIEEPVFAI